MEYTIEYLEDKKIVQVKVKGRVNYQIARAIFYGGKKTRTRIQLQKIFN